MTSTSPAPTLSDRLNRLPIVGLHRKVVFAAGVGLFFDMYEVYLAGTISHALSTEFGLSDALMPFFLGSAFIGMFFGSLIFGRLADRIGRRNAFLLNLGIYAIASLAGAFAPNPMFLVITRFIAGIGVGAEFPVADTYLAEFLPKRLRGRWAGRAYTYALVAVPVVGFASLWLLPIEGLVFPGWRILLAAGAVGAVLILFIRRGLPESPRWLESVGRTDEAERIVASMETQATALPPEKRAVMDEPEPAPVQDTSAVKLPLRALTEPGYIRRRYSMWAVFHIMEAIGYYGFGTLAATVLIARGYDVTHSLLFISLSYIGYPLGSWVSVYLLDRFERKYLLMVTAFGMAVFGLLFGTSTIEALIVAFGFMFTVTGQIFANAYHVYQAEIFPTSLRSTATSSTYALSKISAGAMPFVLLPLLNSGGAALFFGVIAAAMLVIVFLVGFVGPRTTGRSVDDINPVPSKYLPASAPMPTTTPTTTPTSEDAR